MRLQSRDSARLSAANIEEEFKLRPDIINGDISASASHTASRQKRIKAFQEKSGFGVIVLSPVAVGFGVNIQRANHVIHYTRTWNPAKEDQATDRAYRIGQQRPVYVYYPVVHAHDFTTFDIKLDELLEYKRKLAEDMLNGSGDIAPGDFNIVDVVPGTGFDTPKRFRSRFAPVFCQRCGYLPGTVIIVRLKVSEPEPRLRFERNRLYLHEPHRLERPHNLQQTGRSALA